MNAQQQRDTARSRMPLLRDCYQSFLLHLILSLCITVMLLLSVMGLSSFMPNIPAYLQSAALFLHRPCDADALSKPAMAQTMMECAVYVPDGMTDAFSAVSLRTAETVGNTASAHTDPSSVQRQAKDGLPVTPLQKPTLADTAPSDSEQYPVIPADHTHICAADLSMSDQYNDANGGILFSNQTGYILHASDFLNAEYPITLLSPTSAAVSDSGIADSDGSIADSDGTGSDPEPLVLILHTHGTEAYAPDGAASVASDYAYRSENTDENIVSVGAVLAQTLRDAGIGVLHCTTMFDAQSYNDSYANAAAYIRQTVAEYPSIAYIFDVHRDALQSSDGSMLRPITMIGEEVCAQVMSVVGTDSAGAYHPDWRENLTVAVQLQRRLNRAYTAFTRPINLRTATFNAQYASGSILLEIGAAGNSVTEARSAAYHLGVVLADLILNP